MSLPLLLALSAGLCRPAAGSILVIQQHDDAAEYQMDDSPSNFGPKVGVTGLGGLLVLSEPADGCGPVEPPPPGQHHWLLLLTSTNCSSGQKVLNAQQAGYSAAIVYNTSGDGYSPMDSNIKVQIPSFFIGLSNGIMLQRNFLYDSGYSIYISGYFPYTFLAFIIPAMLLIVLCLLVLIAIMLYRCISEYRRTARRLLPKRMLAQIPTRRFTADGGGPAGQETCAICLEDYQEGDRLRLLPCRHAFHCACVDPWLLRSRRVCPVCKRRLVSATVAVLAPESEDEQLLQVYRPQRTAQRRSYGATETTGGVPPVPGAATGGDPPASRSRSGRRPRRTRRRQDRPTSAAAPPPGDDVTATAADVTTTADDVRLLGEEQTADELMASEPPAGDPEPTVATCGGDRAKLRLGQYTRLEEPADCDSTADVCSSQSRPSPAPAAREPRSETPTPPPTPGEDMV